MGYSSLEECVKDLESNGHLIRIKEEVDPNLEIASIHLEEFKKSGKALLFENIKGSKYPAVSNLFGSLERKVDIYGVDLLIGKRLFIIPHLFHIYGKMGPSIMGENWNTPWGYADVNVGLGAVISGGMQIQLLKGIKFFTEAEFRGYGPVLRNETSASITLVNKMPFTEKEVQDYYREYDPNQGKASAKGLVRESLRFGVRFTF